MYLLFMIKQIDRNIEKRLYKYSYLKSSKTKFTILSLMVGVFIMTNIAGVFIIMAGAYYIIKNAVKNGIIEADKYINKADENEEDFKCENK